MNRLKTVVASTIVAAGMSMLPVVAQQSSEGQHHSGFARHRGHGMLRHFGAALNLTDAQKATAKQLFASGRAEAEPIVTQLKQVRTDMQAAVTTNNTAQIASLAARQGQLQGQLAEIRARNMAAFYAQLTPEQKAKAEELHQQKRERASARQQRGQAWREGKSNSNNNNTR